jgi:hypothetical protein
VHRAGPLGANIGEVIAQFSVHVGEAHGLRSDMKRLPGSGPVWSP